MAGSSTCFYVLVQMTITLNCIITVRRRRRARGHTVVSMYGYPVFDEVSVVTSDMEILVCYYYYYYY